MQAQLKTAKAKARPKFLIEPAKPTQMKIVLKKFPTLKNKSNTRNTSQTKNHSKNDTYGGHKNGCNPRQTRTPAYNSRFAKAGGSCFYDSEVLNSSFVHLMKFSAENPRLRKAAKRYRAF